MVRGTTAQFKFRLPYNIDEINKNVLQIAFWQEGYKGPSPDRPLPIVKVFTQCNTSNIPNELTVKLNKEETLRFTDERKAYCQLQGKTLDGIAFASKQDIIPVYPVYNDSILDDDITPTPVPDDDDIVFLDGDTIA